MALNSSVRKPKKAELTEAAEAALFQSHLKSLGLGTESEYRSWCVQNGFAPSTRKTRLQREAELDCARRAFAEWRMSQKKREQRSFRTSVEQIFRGELHESQVTSPALKLICQAHVTLQANAFVRNAFRDLLCRVGESTDLIQTTTVISQYGFGQENSYLGGLLAVAHHAHDWLRRPDSWQPATHNIDRQFQSLTRYLFARWPVPGFMDSVWFQGTSREALERQRWFLHLGRGDNIRTAELPIACTKRIAHHFMLAPADYTVEDALRWGQIHAWGGGGRLVKAILGTRLRTTWDHDDFWATVIQFLIDNPMLDLAHVGPLVDYLQNEKFNPQESFVDGRIERRPPPQPNLTMKGRSPDTLLKNVERWHRTLSKTQQGPAEWAPSGISGFRFIEGAETGDNAKIWTITELHSSAALIAEGRKMKHCVASYVRSCQQGRCSIWTLDLQSNTGSSKVLTLEVLNATRTLVQARGKCNVLPTQKERGILHRWAEKAGLEVAKWV